jgi:L-amino acid N-acyltransferase YncA
MRQRSTSTGYSLDLRTDASSTACGGTLMQEHIEPETKSSTWQVIAFVSQKFSDAAARWDIPKKEA